MRLGQLRPRPCQIKLVRLARSLKQSLTCILSFATAIDADMEGHSINEAETSRFGTRKCELLDWRNLPQHILVHVCVVCNDPKHVDEPTM